MTVAASIEVPANRRTYVYGGVLFWAVAAATRGSRARQAKQYPDLMAAISQDVDDLLVGRVAPADAGQRWFAMDQMLRAQAAKARRRSWIYLRVFLAIIALFIAIVVVATGSPHHRW